MSDEAFGKWFDDPSDKFAGCDHESAKAGWEAGRADLVRQLGGEWGEMEVGPTDTVEDLVEHIHATARVMMGFVWESGEWQLGPVGHIYNAVKLRVRLGREMKQARRAGWQAACAKFWATTKAADGVKLSDAEQSTLRGIADVITGKAPE